MDKLIEERIHKPKKLRFYDEQSYINLTHLPKWLRDGVEHEDRVITEDSPLFIM